MRGELSVDTDIAIESAGGQQVFSIEQSKRRARARLTRPTAHHGEIAERRDRKSEPIIVTAKGRIVYSNGAGAALLGARSGAELAGRSFADFVSKDLAHDVLQHMERREAGEPPDLIEYPIERLDGGGRYVEAFLSPTNFAGRPAAHCLLRDITDVEQYPHRSSALFDAVSEGFWSIEFAHPIPLKARPEDQARRIYESGRIGHCNETMALMLGAHSSEELLDESPASFPLFHGVAEQLVRSRYSLRRWVSEADQGNRTRTFIINAVGTIRRSKLVQIWGNCTEITDVIDVERRMVSSLENQLRHIGHELHDELGQVLTATSLIGECIKVDSACSEKVRMDRVRRLVDLTKSAREIAHGLHRRLAVPSRNGGDSLMEAIAHLCNDTDRATDVRCSLTCEEGRSLPVADKDGYLYRIIHEAVANAVKHARAAHINISIGRGAQDEVVVEIADDGIGFDEDALPKDTVGLAKLYYWARRAGAQLQIESASGCGTSVKCTLPVCRT